jgi:hypothetical protein
MIHSLKRGSLWRGASALAAAGMLLAAAAGPAAAANQFFLANSTITAQNLPMTGLSAPTCTGGEVPQAHFIINVANISGGATAEQQATDLVGTLVSATFLPSGGNSGLIQPQGAIPSGVDQARIDISIPLASFTGVQSATFVTPIDINLTSFVLSDIDCGVSLPGVTTNPPPVGQTPELSSVALFGSGALGLAGYAMARVRAKRREES